VRIYGPLERYGLGVKTDADQQGSGCRFILATRRALLKITRCNGILYYVVGFENGLVLTGGFYMNEALELGFTIPNILVPAEDINLKKWACVACDQYTSQPGYWADVAKFVGSAASTLHIMLPEIYLEDENLGELIAEMKQVMRDYITDGVLEALPRGIMLTERHIGAKVRKGILLAMDLEQYDYDISKKPAIRATEETVLSRIPPRVMIRRGAILEMPHIMLLIDDEQDEVIGNLHMQRDSFQKVYDFELMMGGGRLEGWIADEPKIVNETINSLSKLKRRDNMLYCVGDGNHSLATAKTVWEEMKKDLSEEERENHPARFALCEVINLRDRAVEFMPIHRMIFNVNPSVCAHFVVEKLKEKGRDAKLVFGRWNPSTLTEEGEFVIPFRYHEGAGKLIVSNPESPLAVGEVQDIFDEYISENPSSSIDYIHGDDAFMELSNKYDCIGFYFDAIKKSDFFDLIVKCGVLPKKTFSLGEAEQKRYYMECRLLTHAKYEEPEQYPDELDKR